MTAVLAPATAEVDLEARWRAGTPAAELAAAAARVHGLPLLGEADLRGATSLAGGLSRRYLRGAHAHPVTTAAGRDVLAIADPGRRDVIEAVHLALGRALPLAVASFEDIAQLFDRADTPTAAAAALDPEPADDAALDLSVDALQDLARGGTVVRAVEALLERAVEGGATDIHLETERDALRVRLRIDGVLRPEKPMPRHLAPAVISRVKILAGLDIAERRVPQDGRATVRVGSVEADVRVAIMPTVHGETAVLRILVKDTRLLDLSRIGMADGDRATLAGLIAEPHGLVIVTGPTGSGKTTTLATVVSMLNEPGRKIVTVEDPVEYQIAGVHQTPVRPAVGITFPVALRAFLRHDPDIIMVGEMRDGETAAIGVQAALTGHLVLSTLHTNSAIDAPVRLIDMGVEPYLLGATLRGVIGQRLVRRLCPRCRRPAGPLREAWEGDAPVAPDALAYAPGGCEACGQTGYRGRVGIFEVLRVGPDLRPLLRAAPDPDALRAAAGAQGFRPMLDDGLAKVAAGLTSLDEVRRATG